MNRLRHPMVRALDIPELVDLERMAELRGTDSDDFQKFLLTTCTLLFDSCMVSMPLSAFENSEEFAQIAAELIKADPGEIVPEADHLLTGDPDTPDQDVVERMLELNWDLRDIDGRPLRIARHVALTIESAELGVAGKLPDSIRIGSVQ